MRVQIINGGDIMTITNRDIYEEPRLTIVAFQTSDMLADQVVLSDIDGGADFFDN